MAINTSNYSVGMAKLYWMSTPTAASTNALYRSVKAFNATFSLGNIVAAEIAPEITYLDHYQSLKGDKRKDRTVAVMKSVSVPFTFDEMNATNMKYFFYTSNAGTNKYVVMGSSNVPQEGCAVLAFSTDIGKDFMYVIPRCALKADGGLGFNIEDWMTGKFSIEVLYMSSYNASGTATAAPYGFLDLTAVATAYGG